MILVTLAVLLAPTLPVTAEGTQERALHLEASGTHLAAVRGLGVHHQDTWDLPPTGCLRTLFVTLDLAPATATGQDDAPIDVAFEMRLDITDNGTTTKKRLHEPVQDRYVTTLSTNQTEVVGLVLVTGVDVQWSLQLWGRMDLQAEGCEPEPLQG